MNKYDIVERSRNDTSKAFAYTSMEGDTRTGPQIGSRWFQLPPERSGGFDSHRSNESQIGTYPSTVQLIQKNLLYGTFTETALWA